VTISGVCSLLVCLMPRPRPCHQRQQHHHRSEAGVGGVRSEDAAHLLPTTQKNSENPIPSPNHIRWCVGSKSQLNPMVNSRTTNPITTANVWWEVSPANQWLVSARYRGDPSEVIDRMASNACRPEYTRERWRNAPPRSTVSTKEGANCVGQCQDGDGAATPSHRTSHTAGPDRGRLPNSAIPLGSIPKDSPSHQITRAHAIEMPRAGRVKARSPRRPR
jgi:hypothetical protein